MSDYEKSQEAYAYDYTSTRPGPEQNYADASQTFFDTRYSITQADEAHALAATHQISYPGPSLTPRDTDFQASSTTNIDTRTRCHLEITSPGPYSVKVGETFRLSFRSTNDYTARAFKFIIWFDKIPATVTLCDKTFREPFHHYTIGIKVPSPPSSEHTPVLVMPLMLEISDEDGQNSHFAAPEQFSYLESLQETSFGPTFDVSRKRKYAEDTTDYNRVSAKRSASTPLYARSQPTYLPTSIASAYNFGSAGLYAMPTIYDRSMPQQRSYVSPVAQQMASTYSGSHSLGDSKARHEHHGGFRGYPAHTASGLSPRMSVARSQSGRSPSASNPPLIRTSILQPQTTSSFRTPGFNPYTLYPTAKAKLEVQGDLLTMANVSTWSDDEKKTQRRLVEFQRRQEDSIIHASFKSVTVEERTQGANCVSCILWEERGECFVTSVDAIQLLEGLVGVRFTVEEKNRIRRNLEGFKPLTVSKQKEDSESFFRLIMGFPNPKPRNIEKDVKVFPWSILSNALRKIISKYSASYASTSSVLTPTTTNFMTSVPEAVVDHLPVVSPRSSISSAPSRSYSAGLTSTVMPASRPRRMNIEATADTYEQMRHSSQSSSAIGHWNGQYASTTDAPHYTIGHGPHTSRTSWDLNAFTDQPPPSNSSLQQLQYYPSGTQSEH